jgi:hypothetical protein
MSSNRTEGAVLIGRRDNEYWFVDSVFRHGDDLYGCTGMAVYPVSKEDAENAMSPDNLAERVGDYWHERTKDSVKASCTDCRFGPREEGCEHCGYETLSAFCARVAETDGYHAVFDFPGHTYQEGLEEKLGPLEFADCSSCGRIFAGFSGPVEFDEVYNRKALVACQAYEAGAVDYDYTCRVIFGD